VDDTFSTRFDCNQLADSCRLGTDSSTAAAKLLAAGTCSMNEIVRIFPQIPAALNIAFVVMLVHTAADSGLASRALRCDSVSFWVLIV
jgi:hypothetical protein